ncbi:MAG: O-antigen ligase family protein [bacterium]|nr:O-antigen ligase family protein [bacterium]
MNGFIGTEETIMISGVGWIAVAVMAAGAFLLARRRADWGIALVVAALPLYQVRGSLGVPTTLLELMLGAVVLGLLSRWPRYRPVRSPFDPWLALWVLGSLLAAVLAPDPKQALGLWRAFFLEPVVFFVAARSVFRTEPVRPLLYGAIGAIGITAAWAAVLAASGSALSYDGRLAGPFQSPNFVAHLAVPLTLLVLGWPGRLSRLVRFGPVVLGLVLLAGSQSRGGLLALAAGGLALAFLRSAPAWRKRITAAVVIGGLLIAGVFLNADRDDRFSTRPVLWKTAAAVIAERPLLGAGPEHFQDEVRARVGGDEELRRFVVPRAPDAHNLFLVTWTEWGLATLAGLISLLATLTAVLWRRRDRWVAPAAAMAVAILAHGLVDTPVLKNDLAIIFMLVFVLAALPRRRVA